MGVGTTIGAGIGTAIEPGIGTIIGSGLGSLAQGAYDWWQSGKQEDQINNLEQNNVRPNFDIPQGATDALNNAKGLASQIRLPGQSTIEGRLDQTTANRVSLAERAGLGGTDLINNASKAYGDQQNSENQLGVAAAQNYNENQKNLQAQQNNMANWQNMKWNWETGDPYQSKQRAIAALKGAQLHNQEQGFSNVAGGLTMGLTGLADKFDWFGDGTTNTSNTGSGTNGIVNPETETPTNFTDNGQNPDNPRYSNFTDKMMNSGMGYFLNN